MGPRRVARVRFPRGRRIRKRREFLLVQGQGRRLSGRNFLFFFRPRELSPPCGASNVAMPTRFGITVTRKVGNAVTRNRIKRVVREGCRQLASSIPPGLDVVVIAKSSATLCGLAEVRTDLGELLGRLGGGRRP